MKAVFSSANISRLRSRDFFYWRLFTDEFLSELFFIIELFKDEFPTRSSWMNSSLSWSKDKELKRKPVRLALSLDDVSALHSSLAVPHSGMALRSSLRFVSV